MVLAWGLWNAFSSWSARARECTSRGLVPPIQPKVRKQFCWATSSRHLCARDPLVSMWLECIIFSTHLSRSQEVKIEGNRLSQGRKTSGNWNKVFFPQSRKPFSEFLDSTGLKDCGVDLRPMPRLPIPIKKSWLTDSKAIRKFLLSGRKKNKHNEPKPHTFPICLENASATHFISIKAISNPLPSIYNNRLSNCDRTLPNADQLMQLLLRCCEEWLTRNAQCQSPATCFTLEPVMYPKPLQGTQRRESARVAPSQLFLDKNCKSHNEFCVLGSLLLQEETWGVKLMVANV